MAVVNVLSQRDDDQRFSEFHIYTDKKERLTKWKSIRQSKLDLVRWFVNRMVSLSFPMIKDENTVKEYTEKIFNFLKKLNNNNLLRILF